ncbi:MAG: acetyl-CoA C-acetyltransferase [Alphaproteobacteria bacterium]|nr:acetyl-CoA C-acetyltransferase [Alphaproteobacteria bacterium]MCB9698220.1 acetyl-CoA C-acetyltransferase [Alphaproteobacteria bacterium]
MGEAYLYDAVRTPRGRGKDSGSLYTVRPIDLLAGVMSALQERTGFASEMVEDAIIGCVTQAGEQGTCIARLAALQAWGGMEGPGVTLNRFCGSGLEAVNQAAAQVASGFHDLIVAGGVESMSRVGMGSDGGAMFDPDFQWKVGSVPQGISADLIATLRGFSRSQVDAFAVESQRRAAAAVERNAFAKSIVPVKDLNGLTVLAADELPRKDTTLESLSQLQASFAMLGTQFGLDALVRKRYPEVDRIEHVHHAGNSSGIVDGAAALLVGSKEAGEKLGLKPRARIRSVGLSVSEPLIMLYGPMPATRRALDKAGMSAGDIDLYEVNEAFACVPMAFMDDLGVPHEKVNVNGGAIAFGHPLGATGAMILNTVLDELEARGLGTGLATLCIGGGMGIATIIERV